MTGTGKKRRFRISLRVIFLAPIVGALLLVLFDPRIVTGHFCYVTIDRLDVTDNGAVSVAYSRIVTPGTIVTLQFPHCSASGATSGGAFLWYVRGTASGGGGVNLQKMGLEASAWRDAIQVEEGETYRVELGQRLTLYSLPDPATGEQHEGYIEFQKYPRR